MGLSCMRRLASRPLRKQIVDTQHKHLRLGRGNGARQSDLVVEVRHVVVLVRGDLGRQRLRRACMNRCQDVERQSRSGQAQAKKPIADQPHLLRVAAYKSRAEHALQWANQRGTAVRAGRRHERALPAQCLADQPR